MKKHALTAVILLFFTVGWQFRPSSADVVRFGKFYLYDQTLYVSELTRGVRQIDIAAASNPTDLGLINIEENHDNALFSTMLGRRILYADSRTDLLVFDVTNPASPKVLDTLKNIFGQSYAMRWGNEILFSTPDVMPVLNDRVGGSSGCHGCEDFRSVAPTSGSDLRSTAEGLDTKGAGSGAGRAGSMARFAIVDNYLYCVDYSQLYVFEIDDPAEPRFIGRIDVGWGIETIFPYGEYLFIGGQNGMFIYSRSDPRNPQHVSTFEHVRACDPVVVEDTLAYVTLRGGTRCGTVVSGLHIVTVADLFKPRLLVSYPLPQPMGLDVRNNIAYVCDDSSGVFILDTSDPKNIRELSRITEKPGYDTMLENGVLIVVNENAVSFYDVAQPDAPYLVGRFQLPA